MPTLLAPLPPPSASRMELPTVSFFGRTFEEYTRFFALDPAALRRHAVLDVAAGPSSFTAEAVRHGVLVYHARPPLVGAEVELEARAVRQELTVATN